MTRAQAIKNALRWGFSADERKAIRQLFDDKVRRNDGFAIMRVCLYPPTRIERFEYNAPPPWMALLPKSDVQWASAPEAP